MNNTQLHKFIKTRGINPLFRFMSFFVNEDKLFVRSVELIMNMNNFITRAKFNIRGLSNIQINSIKKGILDIVNSFAKFTEIIFTAKTTYNLYDKTLIWYIKYAFCTRFNLHINLISYQRYNHPHKIDKLPTILATPVNPAHKNYPAIIRSEVPSQLENSYKKKAVQDCRSTRLKSITELLPNYTTLYLNLSLLFFGLFAPSFAFGSFDKYDGLAREASIFSSGSKHIRFEELLQKESELSFQPLGKFHRTSGLTKGKYWVRMPLENLQDESDLFYLEVANPTTDVVTMHLVHENGTSEIQINGDLAPFSVKSVPDHNNFFQIKLAPHEKAQAYFDIQSDGDVLQLSVTRFDSYSFVQHRAKENMINGLFYGLLVLTFLVSFFLSFDMKRQGLLSFSFYIISSALMQFSIEGLFHQFIPSSLDWLNEYAVLLFSYLTALSLIWFVDSYLNLRVHARRLRKAFNLIYVLLFICIAALILIPEVKGMAYTAINIIGLLILGLIISAFTVLSSKQRKVDIYFKLSILFLSLGFVVYILNNLGIIPYSPLTEIGPKIGTTVEVLFLSISMIRKLKELRIQNEQNYKLAKQREVDANELKSSFLSNLSHELRTPLNAIIGGTSMIKANTENDKTNQSLDMVLDSSMSLLGLINNVISYTELENEEQHVELSKCSIQTLIESIAFKFQDQCRNKGLEFNYQIPDELPPFINVDEGKLKMILHGLLDNAVKFTENGQVDFIVNARQHRDKIEFEIDIQDTGSGIAEQKLPTIFDSFTKKTFKDHREHGGLGLGLYLVKSYVEMLGGSISIHNRASRGVICNLKLEFGIAQSKVVSLEKESSFELPDSKSSKKMILYVEDNQMNQMLLQMMIGKWKDMDLVIANHGQEALELVTKEHYDLILMDLHMPIMNGFETIAAIRAGANGIKEVNVPIVALTADATEETRNLVMNLGANDFLTKPINSDDLFAAINSLLSVNTTNAIPL